MRLILFCQNFCVDLLSTENRLRRCRMNLLLPSIDSGPICRHFVAQEMTIRVERSRMDGWHQMQTFASAVSVVATRYQFLDLQIYRSSPIAIAILTPGYARLARQVSAHPGLQSFANFVAIRARLRLATAGLVPATSQQVWSAKPKEWGQ